jgi:hypothetical protein
VPDSGVARRHAARGAIFSPCRGLGRGLDSTCGRARAETVDGRAGPNKEETPVKLSTKNILLLAACICFLVAVILRLDIITIDTKIDWTDLGLLFGFGAFLFK